MIGYTFGIITNGKRYQKLTNEINSIWALNIPHYEIIICGLLPEHVSYANVEYIEAKEAADNGKLGFMRNRLCEKANFDHLIIVDDDILFAKDFYDGLVKFGEDYEVQCCRLLNPDLTRNWDWVTKGGPRGHCLIEYHETDPFLYVTGGRIIMKREVFRKVQWDENKGMNQEEDIDFSRKLQKAGISIKMNKYSTMIHDDPTYTSRGHYIYRKL